MKVPLSQLAKEATHNNQRSRKHKESVSIHERAYIGIGNGASLKRLGWYGKILLKEK
jgi:hypothetical protein